MAPKKANPMEDPPAAPSEEEEEDSEEEETSSGEEDEDDEETPEPTKLPSSPLKKPTAQVATPAKSSSSDDEETGSDSESESDPEPTPKPVASKSIKETTTSKARSSKPVLKRANETEGAQKDAKRKKKKGAGAEEEEDEEPPSEMKKPEQGEEMKKQLFQRLWSEDDEIAVLKGMMEFSTKKGIDPNQDMNAFHDFIKKSLHVDVSRTQLMDKIRRLKKKYVNNLKRGLKKGEDVNFSKPHEQKAYELSKKIWGGREDGNGIMDSAVKKVQSQKGKVNGPKEVDVVKEESTLKINDVEKFLLDRTIGVGGLEDYVINNGLDMVGASKKKELEKRWKKLQIAQLELYVERTNLIREQAMLMLDHFQSSDDN